MSNPFDAYEPLPESWHISEREDLSEPVGSWQWMQAIAVLAPRIRSRLLVPGRAYDRNDKGVLPIGASLHLDLIIYDELYLLHDEWSRRFLDALEAGAKPSTAYELMGESRTTSWRRQRHRRAA